MPATDTPDAHTPPASTDTPRAPAPPPEPPAEAPDYADAFAADYDRWFGKPNTTRATVDTLAGLVGHGPVLELGIGTGRIALPLAARGIDVHGIDASVAMIRHLRTKPLGDRVPVAIGDFARTHTPHRYRMVYLAGGTLFELPDHDSLRQCFANARNHLETGGRLVFDAHLPEALAAAASAEPEIVAATDDLLIRCRRTIDPPNRTYRSDYVISESGRTHRLHVTFCYASPGELDLMAHHAGLRLEKRLGDWTGAPLTDDSTYHVSVYRRSG